MLAQRSLFFVRVRNLAECLKVMPQCSIHDIATRNSLHPQGRMRQLRTLQHDHHFLWKPRVFFVFLLALRHRLVLMVSCIFCLMFPVEAFCLRPSSSPSYFVPSDWRMRYEFHSYFLKLHDNKSLNSKTLLWSERPEDVLWENGVLMPEGGIGSPCVIKVLIFIYSCN